MELVRGLHNLRDHHRGCALSIGNFDGVHRGHQALIERTRQRAAENKVPAAVMVFEPTPIEFFKPEAAPGRVSTFRGKLDALRSAGVERVVCVRFDKKLSSLDATEFVTDILVNRLAVKSVVVGDDFRFGSGRGGDMALLQELGGRHGYTAESVATVVVDGERASSSAVRDALAAADLAAAERLLGRPYSMTGRIRRGLALGRKLNMRTANINLRRKPSLRFGVYIVEAQIGNEQWRGVAALGVRPTLGDDRACLLETHLFDETADLYGKTLQVTFRKFLRAEQKFDSMDELAQQMHADAADARKWFENK